MNHRTVLRIGIAGAAAAVCAAMVRTVLPEFPNQLPWRPWVTNSAYGTGTLLFFACFASTAWLWDRAGRVTSLSMAVLIRIAAFLLSCLVSLFPVVLAAFIAQICQWTMACAAVSQGYVKVLDLMALELKLHESLPVAALMFGTLALVRSGSVRQTSHSTGTQSAHHAGDA